MLTIVFYSPQAPMKRGWNPLLPQINIKEQCESLCKRQIIFENPLESTLSFDIGTEKIYINFWLHVNQSITWCPCQFISQFIF